MSKESWQCKVCKTHFHGNELAIKRALPESIWDLPEHEQKAHVAAEVLKRTVPGGPEQPSDITVGLNNYKCNHHLACHTKTCFKKGEEGRCFLPDMEEPQTRVIYGKDEQETFN